MVKFVPIILAKKIRDKGFVEPCLACYDGSDCLSSYSGSIFKPLNYNTGGSSKTSAPTYEEVKDWLREKHNININISPQGDLIDEKIGSFKPNGRYSGTLDDITIGKEMVASDTICLIPAGDDYYKAFDNAIEAALKQI
jgi:hypothetical protein